jgi:membrane protein YqaA with SNARE-associated domain
LWSRHERYFQVAILAIVAGLGIAVWLLHDSLTSLDVVGYPGVFFFSFLGSSAMVVPLPGILSVCGASLLLSPLTIGLVGAVGETLGEIGGYLVGYGGQTFLQKKRFYGKVRDWMEQRGTIVLFLVSVIPNPFFDVVGVAAGATKFQFRRFLVIVLIGKIIKCIAVAQACLYGIRLVSWLN